MSVSLPSMKAHLIKSSMGKNNQERSKAKSFDTKSRVKQQSALERDSTAIQQGRGGTLPGREAAREYKRSKIWLWLAALALAVAVFAASVAKRQYLRAQAASTNAGHTDLLEGKGKDPLTPGAAHGVFPRGCKWRELQAEGKKKPFWEAETYEYWEDATSLWTTKQPAACRLEGLENPPSYSWLGGKPHSQVWCDKYSCLYQNLWYNNGGWFLVVGDNNTAVDWWSMTKNVDLHVLSVGNTTRFVEFLDYTIVQRSTLVVDFPFFHHPTAIGHWGELMNPLYSIFNNETDFGLPPDRIILLHLKKVHLSEWPRAIMAATLGLQKDEPLPQIILQAEHDQIYQQVGQLLEGISSNQWVCFENTLVVSDLPAGGVPSFFTTEDAQEFRRHLYANHGLPPPEKRKPPRKITYQRKRANRRIVNEEAFLKMLSEYGEVSVVEFNASTTMEEQLGVIASTGVFIAVHTSNLANAQFLQPGSAVFEIVQRNWFWAEMDLTFKRQTLAMGDIHHFAWRATHRNETVYLDERDAKRYGEWTHDLCDSGDCVEAHTNVDVVVNLEEFKEVLDSRLPLIFGGAEVSEAEIEWPGRGLIPYKSFT